jgi:hypothetical protein
LRTAGRRYKISYPCTRRLIQPYSVSAWIYVAGWLPSALRRLGTITAIATGMMNMTRPQQLQVSVVFTSEEIAADLRDRRSDSVALFEVLNEAARDQFALDA